MRSVNMHDAKTHLSKLVEAVASGAESEITISRNGVPAVKLIPCHAEARAAQAWARKGKVHLGQ